MNPRYRSLLAVVLLVVAVVLLLQQHSLGAKNPVGRALQGLAVALMLWARVDALRRHRAVYAVTSDRVLMINTILRR